MCARRALEIEPEHYEPRLLLGWLELDAGRYESALKYIDGAKVHGGEGHLHVAAKGAVMYLLGRDEEAIANFEALRRLWPGFVERRSDLMHYCRSALQTQCDEGGSGPESAGY